MRTESVPGGQARSFNKKNLYNFLVAEFRNWPICHFQMWHFKCCKNTLDASNLIKTCFLASVLTRKRLRFTFQTHNSNLLDPHFSTIFNIQKCNIFVVFFNSPDASEKVDLMLFLWSARLVRIYSLTSFIKAWKSKLCSFFELPAWWKCTQTPLLTKVKAFESSEASKAWKGKRWSFCKQLASWKTTQRPFLTKVGASTSRKLTKWRKFVQIRF